MLSEMLRDRYFAMSGVCLKYFGNYRAVIFDSPRPFYFDVRVIGVQKESIPKKRKDFLATRPCIKTNSAEGFGRRAFHRKEQLLTLLIGQSGLFFTLLSAQDLDAFGGVVLNVMTHLRRLENATEEHQ